MFQSLDVLVGAKFQIDLVGVMDGLLGQLRADEGGQITAHLIAQGQLAVGEGAGAGESGGDVAVGFAVHALVGLWPQSYEDICKLSAYSNPFFLQLLQQGHLGDKTSRSSTSISYLLLRLYQGGCVTFFHSIFILTRKVIP